MKRAVLFSDLHLEAGLHLGRVDPEFDNTRLRDAQAALAQVCDVDCDLLVFCGDMGRTATPGPLAYRMFADALRGAKAKAVAMILGNHDVVGRSSKTSSCLHVVARALPRVRVFDKPELSIVEGIQLGTLPWTPPQRMFAAAPHQPAQRNRIVAEELHKIARGMAAKLKPKEPSLLIGHWLVAGARLPTGVEVIEAGEPLVDPQALGGWGLAAFGHNHIAGPLAGSVWSVGPPMRTGFGEAEITPGYLVAEWEDDAPKPFDVQHVALDDRDLVTLDLELTGQRHALVWPKMEELDGAIVRVRASCGEVERPIVQAQLEPLVAELQQHAFRVIGPQITVERVRRQRSELTTDVEPRKALDAYLTAQNVEDPLRSRVVREATVIMGGTNG